MDIQDLCEILKVKDKRSAMNWCHQHNVEILPSGRKKIVHYFSVQVALDKVFLKSIQTRYPSDWKRLYELYKTGDSLSFALFLQELDLSDYKTISENENNSQVTIREEKRSKAAQQFLSSS